MLLALFSSINSYAQQIYTSEDAKRTVENFMRQIEDVVNGGRSNLDSRQTIAMKSVLNLLDIQGTDTTNYWTGPKCMSDDIGNECKITFNKYFQTKLGIYIQSGIVTSYRLFDVKVKDSTKQVGLEVNNKQKDVAASYLVETEQQINGNRKNNFIFLVDVDKNKIKSVNLKNCISPIQNVQTSQEAVINAEINYTNGNDNQAFNDLVQAVELNPNDYKASYRLGMMYYWGKGCQKSYTKAFELFQRAAELGYADAQYMVGWCYQHGEENDDSKAYLEICMNTFKAISWYEKAANQGHANACFHLGYIYRHGHKCDNIFNLNKPYVIEVDYNLAFKYFMVAAKKGISNAQQEVGACYEFGFGVSENLSSAIEWYKKAAKQDNYFAKEALKRLGIN